MLILASKSAARRTLLRQVGLRFTIQSADINERSIESAFAAKSTGPGNIALELAAAKALAVSAQSPGNFIIGADQTLWFEGKNLHKPHNMKDARHQLQSLRGKTHTLYSAVALVKDEQRIWQHVSEAHLTMRSFTDIELESILTQEGEVILSSVGAYRIEGPSIQLFDRIEGDYFTILGLPLLDLLAGLRQYASEVFLEST